MRSTFLLYDPYVSRSRSRMRLFRLCQISAGVFLAGTITKCDFFIWFPVPVIFELNVFVLAVFPSRSIFSIIRPIGCVALRISESYVPRSGTYDSDMWRTVVSGLLPISGPRSGGSGGPWRRADSGAARLGKLWLRQLSKGLCNENAEILQVKDRISGKVGRKVLVKFTCCWWSPLVGWVAGSQEDSRKDREKAGGLQGRRICPGNAVRR